MSIFCQYCFQPFEGATFDEALIKAQSHSKNCPAKIKQAEKDIADYWKKHSEEKEYKLPIWAL